MARYATGAIATGVFSATPSTILLYFCTEHIGLAPSAAAFVLFFPKAWAIILDPLIGALSDRTRTRWGRRAPFLVIGGCGMAIAFAALFAMPQPGASAWLIGALYFALATLYSIFAVPFITIPAEASEDARVRESLNTWRMSFAMIGILIGAGAAPYLVDWGGGGSAGYARMALILASGCVAAALLAALAAPRLERTRIRTHPEALTTGLGGVLCDLTFVALALTYILQIAAIGIFSALAPYYVAIGLGRPQSDTGGVLAIMLIAAIAAMPVWHWISQRIGAQRALLTACLVYGASLFALSVVGNGATLLPPLIGLGVGFAGLQLLPFALLAHLAHARAQNGAARHGAYTGAWTASEKLGLALGPAIAALALGAAGYHPSAEPSAILSAHVRGLTALAPIAVLALSVIGTMLFGHLNARPVKPSQRAIS